MKQSDSIHSILHSAKRFLTGTVFSRISGLLRDVAMAAAFGTEEAVAAFLVAFRLSHLLRRLFGEGALQSAFIPEFEKLRHEDPDRAFGFFHNLSTALIGFLSVLILVVMSGIGLTLTMVDLQEGNREILWLTLLMMPSLLFICLYGINASLLQCEKSYFISGIAPLGFNLVWIFGVGCLYTLPARTAMPWLAGFVILACLSQWAITVPTVVSILRVKGFRINWMHYQKIGRDVKTLIKPLCLGILGVSAAQINNAMDSVFARYASPEGPAYLWYALRIQQLPLALFGIALSGAILPPLSRAAKDEDNASFQHYFLFGLKQIIAVMLPITVGIFLLGESSVLLLYGHGDFHAASVSATADCLWAYGLGLIPMSGILILSPALYAQKEYRIPTLGSFFAVGINLALNTLLIFVWEYGPVSVALATTVSAWFNFFFLFYKLKQYIPAGGIQSLLVSCCKICGASLVAFFGAWLIYLNLFPSIVEPSFIQQCGKILFQSLLFLGFFASVCWILKPDFMPKANS